jgi:regulator of protease activity HflC (stomatin/prohibitin superfamily)
MMNMLWFSILVIAVSAGLLAALIFLKAFFLIAQGQAAVIERLKKFNRVVYSGLHLRIPFLETFRNVGYINRPEYRKDFGPYRIDLREQIFDLRKQRVITKDNVPVDVDSIIYYKVNAPELTVYGITDLPKAVEQLALTSVRNEFGKMDLDISLGARTQINQNLNSALDEATGKWGIRIIRVEVQEIIPPADLKDTMEKQMVAERERRVKVLAAQSEKEALVLMAEANKQQIIMEAEAKKAREVLQAEAEKQRIILEAEASREQQILQAQGKKEAILLESEGERQAKINLAEGQAASIIKQLNSEAEGLARISQALNAEGSNQTLLVLKSFETAVQIAEKLGNGQATKLFFPQEVSGLMGTLFGIAEGVGLTKRITEK